MKISVKTFISPKVFISLSGYIENRFRRCTSSGFELSVISEYDFPSPDDKKGVPRGVSDALFKSR
jgi:hypothetical protein